RTLLAKLLHWLVSVHLPVGVPILSALFTQASSTPGTSLHSPGETASAEWSVILVLTPMGHAGRGPPLAGPMPAVTVSALMKQCFAPINCARKFMNALT